MRKLIFSIVMFAVIIATPVFALDAIKPFGGVSWESNMLEIINTAKSRNDIKAITMKFLFDSYRIPYSLEVTSLSENEILNEFVNVINSEQADLSNRLFKYKDLDGDKPTFVLANGLYYGEITIIASPVVLSGLEFNVMYVFKASMGVMQKTNIIKFLYNNETCFAPYYLDEVVLRAKSFANTIPTEMRNKIKEDIYGKYKDYLIPECKKNGKIICKGSFKDINGEHTLNISDMGNYFDIIYKNIGGAKQYEDIYIKHQIKVKSESSKAIKDSTNDL